jgi:hypothetical protein
MLARHGNGDPRDHLDTRVNQLTPKSEACVQFEALIHPLDNVLHGIPSWTVEEDRKQQSSRDVRRQQVREHV